MTYRGSTTASADRRLTRTSLVEDRTTRLGRESGSVKRIGLLIVSLSAYAALLHWTYENKISPLFSLLGLRYRDPDPTFYAAALLLAIFVGCFLPVRLRKPSDFVVWVLYVMTCVPSILVPQYARVITPWASMELGLVVAASFLLVILLSDRGPGIALPRLPVPAHILWLALGVISIVVYAYMAYVTGLSVRLIGLTDVQPTRFAYQDAIAASGPALAYLIGVQGNVINPLFMVRGVYSHNWLMTTAGVIGQILIFSATGYKMVILSVPVSFAVSLMFRRPGAPFGRSTINGTVAAGLIALLADRIAGASEYTLVFVGRLALIPGVLTAAHVLVFAGRAKAEWGYSFLAPFVHYPYSTSPAMLVGAEFSGNSRTAANASFLADGYANLGYPGIFIEAFVVVLLMWALDGAAKGLPMKATCVILLVPSIALVNTSVFTSLITGGCGFAVLILMMLPREGWGMDRGTSRGSRVRRDISRAGLLDRAPGQPPRRCERDGRGGAEGPDRGES